MKSSLELLKDFGLHENDILVYEALLSLGLSKTGVVIKKTGIVSSRVYESLALLIKKGLVSYQVRNNIRYYRAESPTSLIEENKLREDALKKIMKEIKAMKVADGERNEVNIFEGKRGFKQAFIRHVEMLQTGDTLSFVSFSANISNARELVLFFNDIDRLAEKKKCAYRMILDRGLVSRVMKYKDIPEYKISFMPAGYFSPMAINISRREVLLSIWGSNPLVVSIKNPLIVKSFLQNFEFMWGVAEKFKE